MTMFTPAQTAAHKRFRHKAILAALAVFVAIAAWAIATAATGSGSRATHGSPTPVSAFSGLPPAQQRYVQGITSLTPAQLRAAFGTEPPSSDNSLPAVLTPHERRYVQAIASMNFSTLAAAFDTGQ